MYLIVCDIDAATVNDLKYNHTRVFSVCQAELSQRKFALVKAKRRWEQSVSIVNVLTL